MERYIYCAISMKMFSTLQRHRHAHYLTIFTALLTTIYLRKYTTVEAVHISKMRLSYRRPNTNLLTIICNMQVNQNHSIPPITHLTLQPLAQRCLSPLTPCIVDNGKYVIAFASNNSIVGICNNTNDYRVNKLHSEEDDDKTFVSGHYRLVSSEIMDYLYRKRVEFVEHPLKFTLKYCPFCPPHKFKSDNLFKHEIFKNTGNSYCHRCNYRGSLFDLKKAFGDLDGSLFSSFNSYQYNVSPSDTNTQNLSENVNIFGMDSVIEYVDNLFNPNFADVLDFLTKKRGLTPEILRKYFVGAGEFAFNTIITTPIGMKNSNSLLKPKSTQVLHKCIVFPWLTSTKSGLSVERIKIRSIADKSKMKILPPNGSWGLFGDHLRNDKSEEIVLTEGEIDAMSVYQSTGKIALSFPNGANSLPIPVLPRLEPIEKLYIWLDFDAAGQNSVDHFANKLGLGRTLVVREIDLPKIIEKQNISNAKTNVSDQSLDKMVIKDANDALMHNVDLNLYLKAARQISHSQIMSFRDLRQLVYEELSNPASTCGIPCLTMPGITELTRGHRRGELSVWTGPTGAGKTTLLSQLSLDYCIQGVSTLWGSFEINNVRLAKMMLRQFCGRNLEKDLDQFEFYADKFQQLPLKFMKFHGSTSIDQVIDAMDYAAYVFDVGHIIIDNLQFMLSGQQGKALDVWEVQNRAIEKFRRFSTQKNVHISLVVHPRKEADGAPLGLSSVFGSVKSTQEADNVFIVQNVIGQHRSIDLKKNRFAGRLGRVVFKFDPVCLIAQQISIDTDNMTSMSTASPKDSGILTSTPNTRFDPENLPPPTPNALVNVNPSNSRPYKTGNQHGNEQSSGPNASDAADGLFSGFATNSLGGRKEGGGEVVDSTHIKPINAVNTSENKSDPAVIYDTTSTSESGNSLSNDDEQEQKTTVTLRSVTIDEGSSIAQLRNFIKTNNLSDVIKTAGKGIKKADIFQKILSHVPPSTIKFGFQTQQRSYSTVSRMPKISNYPFTVSGTVPILDRQLAHEKFPDLFDAAIDDLYVYTPKKRLSEKFAVTNLLYITKEKHIPSVARLLIGCDILGIDTETTGLNPRQDSIRLIQISTPKGITVIFDMLKISPSVLLSSGVIQQTLNTRVMKIFHNAKFDISFLKILGVNHDLSQFDFNPISLPIFDTLIASKLVEASRLAYGFKLDQVCQRYLGVYLDKTQQYSDWTVPVLSEEQVLYSAR